jgi:hypothetical protein
VDHGEVVEEEWAEEDEAACAEREDLGGAVDEQLSKLLSRANEVKVVGLRVLESLLNSASKELRSPLDEADGGAEGLIVYITRRVRAMAVPVPLRLHWSSISTSVQLARFVEVA